MTSGLDGFTVSTPTVGKLADTFTTQQQNFHDLGSPLTRAAAAVNTGDGGVDADTRAVAGQVNDVFTRIGAAMGQAGAALADVVAGYQDADQQVADGYRGLGADSPDVPPTTPPAGPVAQV
jgi:hypothetical protein